MKKKLLKPPSENGEVLLIPSIPEISSFFSEGIKIGTAHQAYFFNPGVALKFLFPEGLPGGRKEIIFVDTDRTQIEINLPPPSPGDPVLYLELIKTDEVLYGYHPPPSDFWEKHFGAVEGHLGKLDRGNYPRVLDNFRRFREIFFSYLDREFLRETLALSFLNYFGLETGSCFFSELLPSDGYKEFFTEIYERQEFFRQVFNQVLLEYKREFKFRYKNYPFPQLEEGELPFWLLKEGRRFPLFRDDIKLNKLDTTTIFPRASTLTLFLRLFRHDIFIHGIGGGNYEWIQDRLMERFFQRSPPPYIVLSGTFLLGDSKERDFPYFFYSPDLIKKALPVL